MKKTLPQSIQIWLDKLRSQCSLTCRFIAFSNSKEWKFINGSLCHLTNKFFSIVGIRWKKGKKICNQPIILQTDIGTLGFLLRDKRSKKELLIHAKVEPGNVKKVQFAPTCQATSSNIEQVHNGSKPPYSDWFENSSYICETFQSEQGTRFFGKKNRNVLRVVSQEIPLSSAHKWISTDTIFSLIDTDFLINTDARSVLVSSPWGKLVNREPFTRYRTEFANDLYNSYRFKEESGKINNILHKLKTKQEKINPPTIIPLTKLKEWEIKDRTIQPVQDKYFEIKQIDVEATGREVPHWDQPIIDSTTKGKVDLVCGRIQGILHFLFKIQIEPGLYNKAELGPTYIVAPGIKSDRVKIKKDAIIRTSCNQSEEGGRFFKDTNQYRIIDIGDNFKIKHGDIWLTLSQVQKLLLEDGWFTNEARSVLSLILQWL